MRLINRLYKIARSRINSSDAEVDGIEDLLGFMPKNEAANAENGPGQQKVNTDPVLAAYYANLELPYGSDLKTVKSAWKKQMQKYHPDLHASDPEKRKIAHELTQGLNRAYEELRKELSNN